MTGLILEATRVELIVDDDEGFHSFHAVATRPRRFLSLARSSEEPEVYCELNDQSQGFRSRTVSYELRFPIVTFTVEAPESFELGHATRRVDVRLPPTTSAAEVATCLRAVFLRANTRS